MATVSDLTNTPLSGLTHIDALLDIGPDWNYLTGVAAPNTIYYTFSITSGNESGVTGQQAFTEAQRAGAYKAFQYLQQITGIQFVEAAIGSTAQIHLANIDLEGTQTTGLCSWHSSYSYVGTETVTAYSANAYVYLDNGTWSAQNQNLQPGGEGYQTLLHELGHALGLKHPFADHPGDVTLPSAQDNTGNTIMSYNDQGGPYSVFSPYDIAALNWLYGRDGLGGALGINSTTGGRYITGTTGADRLLGTGANDTLAGVSGNDVIDGGAGTDTVVFDGLRSEYTLAEGSNRSVIATHATQGTIVITNVERFSFRDGSFGREQIVVDNVAPPAPTIAVSKNAAGYTAGNKPRVSGEAEAGSLVRVYAGDTVVAETRADANGIWSTLTNVFEDGLNHTVRATATDDAGNVSASSTTISFHVDATAPFKPTSTMTLEEGGNQPVFKGTAEAGTMIQLVRLGAAIEIGRTLVKEDGTWQIDSAALPNGAYTVSAVSVDAADSATSADNRMEFTIDSRLNMTGNADANRFTPGEGNNAIDGGGGLDTVAYTGARSDFTIARGVYGVTVADKSGKLGTDNLINVERVQFGDTMVALDVDGTAGQVYRLYRAAFDREPDKGGLAYWIKALDTGNYTLNDIARMFLADREARALYSTDPSDTNFVTKLYAHVLHRPAEGAGFDYWVNGLKLVSRAEVLAFFSESPENQAQVIGQISNGIEYPFS